MDTELRLHLVPDTCLIGIFYGLIQFDTLKAALQISEVLRNRLFNKNLFLA